MEGKEGNLETEQKIGRVVDGLEGSNKSRVAIGTFREGNKKSVGGEIPPPPVLVVRGNREKKLSETLKNIYYMDSLQKRMFLFNNAFFIKLISKSK